VATLVRRAVDFWNAGKELRARYGLLGGTQLALQFRQAYVAERGTQIHLSVPGLAHPIALRAGTTDVSVAREHLLQLPLDIPLEADPQVIIDAGANIGMASVYLANRYPRARILALEVEQSNFELLRQNTRLLPNVVPLRRALWSETGHVRILNPRGDSWGFRVASANPDDPGAIECQDVGSLLTEFSVSHVDLIKIDIEGSELAVLSAADLSWLDRVGVLAVELHDRLRPGCTVALDRALEGRPHRREVCGEYVVIRFGAGAA
jgi:FkbM family methyltransferase